MQSDLIFEHNASLTGHYGIRKKPLSETCILSSQGADSQGDRFISDIFAGYLSNKTLMEKQQQYKIMNSIKVLKLRVAALQNTKNNGI